MNNKVNYPKWVSKLKKQLKQARAEIAELNEVLEFWTDEAKANRQRVAALKIECEMYKESGNGFYELLGRKDKSTDRLLSLLEGLTATNADLKRQLRESKQRDARQ